MQQQVDGLEWRDRILRMCMASLYDAAFHSINYNRVRLRSGFASPPPPIDLHELFPEADESQIAKAVKAAERLESSGHRFFELFYRGEGQDALEVIQALHPGFGDSCYTSVLAQAQRGAR